jgi:hypothetical protein
MSKFHQLITALAAGFLLCGSFVEADEAGAQKVVASYRARLADWTQQVKTAAHRENAKRFGSGGLRRKSLGKIYCDSLMAHGIRNGFWTLRPRCFR